MKYKILVIDDDEPIHYLVKSILGKEYQLFHARNAQSAIDILAETKINLILSDIHMPGLTGLELLESIKSDSEKKNIPVLIMTSLPTVEKEQKAMQLGASDFIKKDVLTSNKESFNERIRMKLVTNVVIDEIGHNLEESKNKLVMSLMDSALLGLFNETVDVLCSEIMALLHAEFVGMWVLGEASSKMITQKGKVRINARDTELMAESGFSKIAETQQPYFSNHVYSEEKTFFKDLDKNSKLPAEAVIPIFSISEKGLLYNDLKVPEKSKLFGVIVIKRSRLFSRQEFELTSKLVIQAGTILWRLYRN